MIEPVPDPGQASRHELFERAVFDDPEDVDAWAVYADWLASEGEPLGELISLELRMEAAAAAGHGIMPALASRYAALAEGGPSRWAEPSLAELLARPDLSRSLALEWRRGHPYLARISSSSLRVANELLAALLGSRGLAFLTSLSVSFAAQRDEVGALAFADAPTLASLRMLDIDGWAFSRPSARLAKLDFDWQRAWPRLHTLRLRCAQVALPALAHQRLQALTLSLRHGFEPNVIEQLASARLPALRSLQLFLGRLDPLDPEHSPDRARALVLGVIDNPLLGGPGGLPTLGLCAGQLPPSFFAALADTKLLRTLIDLRLAWSTIGDEHLPALRAVIANAPALERLDLTRNYLSPAAVAELRALLGRRLLAGDQKPDGDRQLPVFGRYGFDDASFG